MPLNFFTWSKATLLLGLLVTIGSALLTADDYYVSPELIPGFLPDSDWQDSDMYAGHIPLSNNEDEINYFFWKFVDGRRDKPLMIWLNGGPGCSSMDGALAENGPIRIDDDGKAFINEGSWHKRVDIVYLDQPVNTGFSFANKTGPLIYDDDLDVVTEHFMQFLDSYFQIFPEDIYKDLMLAGESFAGQYIPFFADAIRRRNDNLEADQNRYNLNSVFIGNGWLDPNNQALSYLPFAKEKNLIDETNPNFSSLLKAHENCQNAINNHNFINEQEFSYEECESILTLLLSSTRNASPDIPSNEVCLNVYDYTLRDNYPACGMNWPAAVQNIPTFFGTEGVLEGLNVRPEDVPRWRECDNGVTRALTNPRSIPSINLFPDIMNAGINIILFNGDHDLICNTQSVTNVIDNLNWGGQKGFSEHAEYYDWIFNDAAMDTFEPAGYVKYDRNLTFINVYNASHMVSTDKSMVSRGILDIYLDDVSFDMVDGRFVLTSTSKMEPWSEDEDEDKDEDDDDSGDFEGDESESEEEDEDMDDDDDGEEAEDKDEDDEEGEDTDEDEDKEDKEDTVYSSHDKFRIVLVTFMSIALAIAIILYIYSKKFKPGMRAILMRSNRKHDQNKTVSWADDLEDGIDFDVDEELSRSETASSRSKSKGSYTSVPTTEESFELEDM
ncbi:hypothetical protein HG535_0B02420 [Zygotorulaspora mrakii]|uniref:Pheromone-processing carboxypeptidase KEX1 n=1 Tax=Zygotorulaspora mrakii TaxID=42260 RepID=A0A7H9AYC9_ZYGMR|nr:uncharacterized protein HG535_0B02420 [Zygotorulaspora mrakii]QLG71203.1 hypothetical protein HG535_0B02420 [Zygotorulaspora mrakii]